MRTGCSITLFGCLAAYSVLFVGNVLADEKVYSAEDLQRIDATLDAMEKQNAESIHKFKPNDLAELLGDRSIFIAGALLRPDIPSVASDLSTEERKYFQMHPREFVLRVFTRELGPSRIERVRKIFSPRLLSKDEFMRRNAIHGLLYDVGDKSAVSEVEALLNSPNAGARFDAAQELAGIGEPAGARVLEGELRSGDQEHALEAACALSHQGHPTAKEFLLSIVHSTAAFDLGERSRSVYCLRGYKDTATTELFVTLLDDKNPAVVEAAIASFGLREFVLDAPLIEKLIKIIETPASGRSREYAETLFLTHAAPGVRERLLRLNSSPDSFVKHAMLQGLFRNGTNADVPLIVGYLDDPNEELRRDAELALRHMTKVRFENPDTDLPSAIANRKAWWEKHKNDPEYRY